MSAGGLRPEVGDDVRTNDEEVLGSVSAIDGEYLEIQGGSIDRPTTWRVPLTAVSRIAGGEVHLSMSRGQVLTLG